MGRWQIRKVAGKKTLQVWDERNKAIVAESPSGSASVVSLFVATLRIGAGEFVPPEIVNLDDQT